MQFHSLWRSPNGLMANIPTIIVFLSILEHHSNGQDTSKGHIASPWQSASR
jgi:hypothetical protein